MPKKISTTKTSTAVVSEQQEEVAVQAPIVAQLEEVKIEKKMIETDSEIETNEKEEVNTVDALIAGLAKKVDAMKELALRSQQDFKKLNREILIERKKYEKGGKKEKKVRNGTTGLDNELKVSSSEFRSFIERYHDLLTDADKNKIVSELKYDSDGSLVISRKKAHQFVNAYVKHNNLQDKENGRKIHMDKTLKTLFPDNAEKKEKGVVVKEENFFFTSVMGAISRHLVSSNAK
jgi:hypothetical protein